MEAEKDNKGHITTDSRVVSVPFVKLQENKHYSFSLLVKRTEKISAASYLLTEHLDKNEPLRTSIRECALSLIKDIHGIRGTFLKPTKEILHALSASLSEMSALFEIALLAKMITEM